jgi:hypothetical protein
MSLEYTPLDQIEKVFDHPMHSPGSSHNLRQIYAELRAGFASGKLKSIAFRKYQLLQLGYLIKDNEKRLEEALASDLGRPPLESTL